MEELPATEQQLPGTVVARSLTAPAATAPRRLSGPAFDVPGVCSPVSWRRRSALSSDQRRGPAQHDVDPDRFRAILGHAPSAVVIVTGFGPGGPVGMSVGSFVSVSLDPPLVGFFPAKTSTSWPRIRATGRFCINLLADDQTDVSRRFAVKGGDKFDGVGWSHGVSGSPVIDDCVAWIDCDVEQELDTGDHVLVLGRVLDLNVARDAHALVFHQGTYTSTAAASISESQGQLASAPGVRSWRRRGRRRHRGPGG
jgi:flavin reductase (DIM6/NTAB) family NADH-FMN oxidoreductase RutF